jgi:hypothetical protein
MAGGRRCGCNRPPPLHLLEHVAAGLLLVAAAHHVDKAFGFTEALVLFLYTMVTVQPAMELSLGA